MFAPYYQAYECLKAKAVESDLEKYFDVYEISPSDIEDSRIIAEADLSGLENADQLQDLKLGLQKFNILRKVFLCTLLALNADGSADDFATWTAAGDAMDALSDLTSTAVTSIDETLEREDGKSVLPNLIIKRESC